MQTLDFEKKPRIAKPSQHYNDIIISGQSLKTMLKAGDRDLITPFGWLNREIENEMVKEFLGEKSGQASHGRIMIYVCPECLDIGCGAITAELEMDEHTAIWKDFGYENGYDPIDFQSFNHMQQLKFDKDNYISKFKII